MHDSFNPPTVSFFQNRHQTNCNKTPLLRTMTSHPRPIHCKHFSTKNVKRGRHKREWKTTNNNKIKNYCPQDKTHGGQGDIYREKAVYLSVRQATGVNRVWKRGSEGVEQKSYWRNLFAVRATKGIKRKRKRWASCDYKLQKSIQLLSVGDGPCRFNSYGARGMIGILAPTFNFTPLFELLCRKYTLFP